MRYRRPVPESILAKACSALMLPLTGAEVTPWDDDAASVTCRPDCLPKELMAALRGCAGMSKSVVAVCARAGRSSIGLAASTTKATLVCKIITRADPPTPELTRFNGTLFGKFMNPVSLTHTVQPPIGRRSALRRLPLQVFSPQKEKVCGFG
ncbi:protein of unknown function (plasmid) [Pseudorhizobium banfieldiae]|uniref:Uncharacterized protein n=1 Tax=Pseudorhizobium banfieldiae TaxID=1125847 RepID=L0NM97_9HYPH|nr:protein of unknown function [Pseudorhizobium banfieldiae]